MIKRNLILRDYQKPAFNYVLESKKCVLSLCPNGGKTEIAIAVVEQYLKINPKHKILILTHSTNVLLNNFYDRLEELNVSFSYSTNFDLNANVHLCIPANEHKILDHYDFIIVDEAHENYLANRVQKIIQKIKPSKELLLTGTPSKFVYEGGYDIYCIALDELDDQYFAKLNIELVASNYNWSNNDYNKDDIVKSTFKYTQEDTNNSMESIVLSIFNRLEYGVTAEEFNDPSIWTKTKMFFKKKIITKTWDSAFKEIGKTLIVCNNIEQADYVQNCLINNGVNSVCSHSKCDIDGGKIGTFKDDIHDVLVVVDRCRIGYNDETLMNLIDMSGTRNIDLIYQMMCRVIRGNQSFNKFYIKVTTNDLVQMAADEIAVNGALMLSNKDYILKYNGKNFNDLNIPVLKISRNVSVSERSNNTDKKRIRTSILPNITQDVFNLLKNIKHDLNKPASIYKLTTIIDAKRDLGLIKKSKYTYEEILALARTTID